MTIEEIKKKFGTANENGYIYCCNCPLYTTDNGVCKDGGSCSNCDGYEDAYIRIQKFLNADAAAEKPSTKVEKHAEICKSLTALYERKNHDYGDSFGISFKEEGMAMVRIRLGDKFNRFKNLSRNAGQLVMDESIKDTLLDLANYAIMTVIEMENEENDT